MTNKPFMIMLVIIAVLLAGNLIAQLIPRSESTLTPILNSAQASTTSKVGGPVFVLDKDSYILTTNSTGEHVYLYYFDRSPKKLESRVEFLSAESAE